MGKVKKNNRLRTIVFIDASNIIYGCRNEGWKVDFKKLFRYLKERYSSQKIYYFAGVLQNNVKQKEFYKVMENIGYDLILKPVKLFRNGKNIVRKANCDVDLTFYAMRDFDKYDFGIFFTGDGDFEVLIKYLLEKKKKVKIIANGSRTAKEIKKIVGDNFTELNSIKPIISLIKQKK
jgi:uncharacterized LabA/DUF88 family protein